MVAAIAANRPKAAPHLQCHSTASDSQTGAFSPLGVPAFRAFRAEEGRPHWSHRAATTGGVGQFSPLRGEARGPATDGFLFDRNTRNTWNTTPNYSAGPREESHTAPKA